MKKDLPGDTEIYVELKTYLDIKDHLEHSYSRWMNEFDGYVFYSVKDYFEKLDEANKNRLFWDMRKNYGLPYMGSKNKLAEEIVNFLP